MVNECFPAVMAAQGGTGVAVRGEADLIGIKASVLRSCINREK
jgi:hypothetical protein